MIEQRVSAFAGELQAIRRDLHAHPELCFKEFRTSALVARELRGLDFTVAEGVAGTGVVGTIRNGKGNRAIAIRADMDALPFSEETGLPYASKTPGVMHACGHDGHTTMLLGLAKYLNRHKNFDGTVHLIFQPAEEDQSGAHLMIQQGLFKTYPVDAIYALHNLPGVPLGEVRVRPGSITAAVDIIDITVTGIAGHGALPHLAVDPVVAASAIVLALQTAISRTNNALDPAVLTVGSIHGGAIATAIPESVVMKTGLRTTSKDSRAKLLQRIPEIIHGQAASFGCRATLDYGDCVIYPVGVNDGGVTETVREVAIDLGQDMANVDLKGPLMFSEDFAFMLEEVPGCYFGIGNGPSKSLHDTGYDFNDALLVPGTAFWARLVEKALPLK